MRKLLMSTAILGAAVAAPGAAMAQDMFRGAADAMEIRASDLMGMRVYASEVALDAEEAQGMQDGWEDIGEINDLVLGRDGSVEAVLVDVGGFLGMGERQVAVQMGALRFVSDSATADDVDDYFLVMNASRANLEEAPDYGLLGAGAVAGDGMAATEAATEAAVEPATEAMTATETEMATDETAVAATGEMATEEAVGDDTAMATDVTASSEMATEGEMATEEMAADVTVTEGTAAEAVAEAPARTPIIRDGFIAAAGEVLTADALQGAAVYDSNDERIGEVGELLLSEDGQISEVVIDVGGFLGIGEKPVAMAMGDIDILQQDGGEEIRVYLSQTREALEAMPNYEG